MTNPAPGLWLIFGPSETNSKSHSWALCVFGTDRIPKCHEMVLELVWGADFCCNRHCRTSPVVLEGFWGQVWPKIGRTPENQNTKLPMDR